MIAPRHARDVAAGLLLCAGLVFSAGPFRHFVQQTAARVRAHRTWARVRAAGTPPTQPGTPAAWLTIPSCGIDTIVLHGDDPENLHRAPGLRAVPGGRVIAAHRDKHFRRLSRLRTGDEVRLEDPAGRGRVFRVTEIEILVPGDAAARLRGARADDRLVLMTCHPFRFFGPAPRRFLAWALPVGMHPFSGHTPDNF